MINHKLSIAVLVLVLLATAGQATGQENIPMPFGGENKSPWDIAFDPWTQYIGDMFYAVLVALAVSVVWIKAGTGPALAFFVVANAVLAFVMPGQSSPIFAIMAAIAFVAIMMRAVIGS